MAERPQISVRFTKTEQKRLQRIADADGRTRAQWVRWVTMKALEEAEQKAKEEGK
jgi:predicted DNA-binding protein